MYILKNNILWFLFWLITPVLCQATETSLYKWKDAEGNIHFSDKLPKDIDPEPFKAPSISISSRDYIPTQSDSEKSEPKKAKSKKDDRYCRKYKEKINKISIYLKHTPNDLDEQKLKDLKQQLKLECTNGVYKKKYKNSTCHRHARKLNKYIIYNKHTPTDRDQQAIKDLKAQIKLECR